jgi:hypothetical protein
MKKSILSIITFTIFTVILTSCTSQPDSSKVDKAAKEVQDAKEKLDKANTEYAEEVKNYRLDVQQKIDANKQLVSDLKNEKALVKKEDAAARNAKIDAIEKRNEELEVRMTNYNNENKENWESFKREFNNDMSELGKAFKDLGTDNAK